MSAAALLEAHRNGRWAVAGASDDPSRFGYKILRALLDHGFDAAPIHPRLDAIDGVPVRRAVEEVPGGCAVLVLVVNPRVGIGLLDGAKAAGVQAVWMQPGAESPELAAKAAAMGFEVVEDCVLVRLSARPARD